MLRYLTANYRILTGTGSQVELQQQIQLVSSQI